MAATERERAMAAQESGQTIHVLTEGGSIIEMSLPLSEPIAERMGRGQIVRVNEDGSSFIDAPEPKAKATAKAADKDTEPEPEPEADTADGEAQADEKPAPRSRAKRA